MAKNTKRHQFEKLAQKILIKEIINGINAGKVGIVIGVNSNTNRYSQHKTEQRQQTPR